MKYLLDASAVLAALKLEAGAERVMEISREGGICVVNLAEVYSKLSEWNVSQSSADDALAVFRLAIVGVEQADAVLTGAFRIATKRIGLSLGDRFCLAVARRHGLIAATTDRSWAAMAETVGVEIELIR